MSRNFFLLFLQHFLRRLSSDVLSVQHVSLEIHEFVTSADVHSCQIIFQGSNSKIGSATQIQFAQAFLLFGSHYGKFASSLRTFHFGGRFQLFDDKLGRRRRFVLQGRRLWPNFEIKNRICGLRLENLKMQNQALHIENMQYNIRNCTIIYIETHVYSLYRERLWFVYFSL